MLQPWFQRILNLLLYLKPSVDLNIFLFQLRGELMGLAARCRLSRMKWHHTNRLILIKMKFVAETVLAGVRAPSWWSSNPCHFFVLLFSSSLLIVFQTLAAAQRISTSVHLLSLDFWAQSSVVLLFLWSWVIHKRKSAVFNYIW